MSPKQSLHVHMVQVATMRTTTHDAVSWVFSGPAYTPTCRLAHRSMRRGGRMLASGSAKRARCGCRRAARHSCAQGSASRI